MAAHALSGSYGFMTKTGKLLLLLFLWLTIASTTYAQLKPVQRGDALYCRFDLRPFGQSTEECAKGFNEGFEMLMQDPEHVKIYQQELARLESSTAIGLGEVYWTLFRRYPSAEAYFKSLEAYSASHKKQQRSHIFRYEDTKDTRVFDYLYNVAEYQVVVAMLEDRAQREPLTEQERYMLNTSQQRAACLQGYLDFMRKNPEQPIDDLDVVNTCYP